MYEYRAAVTKVVDGDTLHVDVDLGMDIHVNTTVRLVGVDTPEMGTDAGLRARVFTLAWVTDADGHVTIRTVKDRREKYGRYLAQVTRSGDGVSLNDALLTAGHARPAPSNWR